MIHCLYTALPTETCTKCSHWTTEIWIVCACVQEEQDRENKCNPLFCYLQPRHKPLYMAQWNEESLTRVPYIFKPLIGIASKVAPPAALPFSCCTAESVSGSGSLEEGCHGGPAGTQEPNWGLRMPPSAATAVLPLAGGRIKTLWLARGRRSSGGCLACTARGGLHCDGLADQAVLSCSLLEPWLEALSCSVWFCL